MPASRFRRWVKIIAIGLVLVVCAETARMFADLFLPVGHEQGEAHLCDQCGIWLSIHSDDHADPTAPPQEHRKFSDTELSKWYAANIDPDCQHTWRRIHSDHFQYVSLAGYRLWNLVSGHGSSRTPGLVDLSADDRAHLENLLRESPEVCKRFIHDKLKQRKAPPPID
jgi:hypothetical protein